MSTCDTLVRYLPNLVALRLPGGRCHMGFLPYGSPNPRIKYHMVNVPHLWDFLPPPPPAPPWNLCWRRFAIEGEGLPYSIIPPWGSSAMGFLPGGMFAIWYYSLWVSSATGFLPGEGLSYGIYLWGTFAIWYNFRGDNLPWYLFPHHEICVGRRFTIEGEALPYGIVSPLGKFCQFRYEHSKGQAIAMCILLIQ